MHNHQVRISEIINSQQVRISATMYNQQVRISQQRTISKYEYQQQCKSASANITAMDNHQVRISAEM
jgi:hypothetical protein